MSPQSHLLLNNIALNEVWDIHNCLVVDFLFFLIYWIYFVGVGVYTFTGYSGEYKNY